MSPLTVDEWLESAGRILASSSVPEPRANAEFLVAHALGESRLNIFLRKDAPLPRPRAALLRRLLARRRRRIPLGYVLGSQPFLGLDLKVDARVLIPRPETEELVEAACAPYATGGNPPCRILDIATGSGAVAIALALRFPLASITATDICPRALQVARLNARRYQVSKRIVFLREDVTSPPPPTRWGALGRWADLVISNPPYIPSADVPSLAPEVLREPRQALDGGPDGLGVIRAVARRAGAVLNAGGRLFMEIGAPQAAAVQTILREAGFAGIRVVKDSAGLHRIASGRLRS